jgi:hypothetical protein
VIITRGESSGGWSLDTPDNSPSLEYEDTQANRTRFVLMASCFITIVFSTSHETQNLWLLRESRWYDSLCDMFAYLRSRHEESIDSMLLLQPRLRTYKASV